MDKVLKLGMLNLVDGNITYWGDEDTNVETIAINPLTEKIYVSGFSFSKDQENINNQFISDHNTYNMPLFTVYETDYTFTETKALFAGNAWIRNILVDFSTNRVVALYDKEYNSDEDSQAVAIDVRTETIEQFQLPPERMQVDGGCFSRDGKGLYVLSVINDQRGVYYYDFETKAYTPILLMEDEFINNFQFVQE